MNFLDRFRYRYDNLKELDANISSDKKNLNYNNPILKSLLSTSVKVTPEIFPKIDNCIQSVFRKLELKNNFNFFVTANHNQTQASCAMMPESDSAEIIITSRMIELLNINELSYVLGHEISHHYYQHNIYPSPNQAKSKMELLKLLHLSRASEISADRAGFLGSGDIENSLKAMLKIASGLSEKHLTFNFSSYLDQLRELETHGKSNHQLWSTHPSFLVRMQALIWFSMTKEYHQFFETKKKGSYSISEIDKKIEGSIKKIIGNEVDVSNKEIFDKALLWGSLNLYLSDKKFSKSEQELFIKKFGKEKAKKAISLLRVSNQGMLEKKVETSFTEASILLKTDKAALVSELKKIEKDMDGNKVKKTEILEKLLNFCSQPKYLLIWIFQTIKFIMKALDILHKP